VLLHYSNAFHFQIIISLPKPSVPLGPAVCWVFLIKRKFGVAVLPALLDEVVAAIWPTVPVVVFNVPEEVLAAVWPTRLAACFS
jgi:hypothetical protein